MLSRLRIERQKRDGGGGGEYGGADEEGEDFDDNDDSNTGDGPDDDFSWPAADVSATGMTCKLSTSSLIRSKKRLFQHIFDKLLQVLGSVPISGIKKRKQL